jgi:NAD+ kinase
VTSPRRAIGFLVHPRDWQNPAILEPATRRAEELGFTTWVAGEDPALTVAEHEEDTAVLVTLGGDGTFLLGARLAAPLGIPVLGVNRGQLGFLTDIDIAGLPDALGDIAEGRHRLVRRSLLDAEFPSENGDGAHLTRVFAVNEVVVKSTGSNLVRLHVDADEEVLGEFDADGIIVATATGSTAYALSAGGPPVDPRVRALVVVPLAPHAVITRAVVLPEAVSITVSLVRGRAFTAADGRGELPLHEGAQVSIRPGPDLLMVKLAGSPPFLQRLREKVRFGTPLKEAHEHWHAPGQHPPQRRPEAP